MIVRYKVTGKQNRVNGLNEVIQIKFRIKLAGQTSLINNNTINHFLG
jgi:hypothetical protein